MNPQIAIFLSHDSSISIQNKNGNYYVYELERLLKQRYVRVDNSPNLLSICRIMHDIILKQHGIDTFETCYHLGLTEEHKQILSSVWGISEFIETYHHISHAACSFYQSPFAEALVISMDGGGLDNISDEAPDHITYFNIYHAKWGQEIKRLKVIPYDLGTAYGLSALPISEITKTKEDWGEKFLSFPGKLMGLTAYGNVKQEWIDPFINFYKEHKHVNENDLQKSLAPALGLSLEINSLSGQIAYDFAATSQYAFEQVVLEQINPFIEEYNLPICLSGGCALNVILNQKLIDIGGPENIFVPPNPSDCGLTLGMLFCYNPPKSNNDGSFTNLNITYSGFPILDIDDLHKYVEKYNAKKITTGELAQLLYEGKIIGLMRGNSEVGPRSLGNRSILCDPSYANMKDKLNQRIKFREFYRPFAPIVRLKDVNKYFEFNSEAEFMSYAPKVKEEWKNKIPAVVHKDSTARIQTITYEQNEYIYDLLTEFEKKRGYGVILNTSFNIKGKPILTTILDTIEVLETTEIDGVVIEGYLFVR